MSAVVVKPLRRDDNFEDGFHDAHLQFPVGLGSRRERRARDNLDQPRLQVIFDEDVVPVQLETMLIVNDYRLDTLKRDIDDVLDILETFVRRLLASGLLEIKAQIFNGPL